MKKLLGIFAVSALTILGCTTAFASNSVQGDADSDGILTAKDSAYVLQKTLDSTFKVPIAILSEKQIRFKGEFSIKTFIPAPGVEKTPCHCIGRYRTCIPSAICFYGFL